MVLGGALASAPDDSRRLSTFLVAAVVYLAVMVMAGVVLLGAASSRWQQDLVRRVTIQLAEESSGADDAEVNGILTRIRHDPGVSTAERVPDERVADVLRQALGNGEVVAGLPRPVVIEVWLKAALPPVTGSTQGRAATGEGGDTAVPALPVSQQQGGVVTVGRLREMLPKALIVQPDRSGDAGVRLASVLRGAGVLFLVVLAGTVLAVVAFGTRMRLRLVRDTLDMVLLLGAEDAEIIRHETGRALWAALGGSGVGFAAAAATMLMTAALAADTPLVRAFVRGPDWSGWLWLLLPPAIAGLEAAFAARFTVRRALLWQM